MVQGTRDAPRRPPNGGYQPLPPEERQEPEQKSCRKFKCRDLIEHSDGRGSLGKIGQLVALTVSSGCFVWMVYQGTMTEFYFTGYMLAWAGANIAGKMADRNSKYRYRDTEQERDYR